MSDVKVTPYERRLLEEGKKGHPGPKNPVWPPTPAQIPTIKPSWKPNGQSSSQGSGRQEK